MSSKAPGLWIPKLRPCGKNENISSRKNVRKCYTMRRSGRASMTSFYTTRTHLKATLVVGDSNKKQGKKQLKKAAPEAGGNQN